MVLFASEAQRRKCKIEKALQEEPFWTQRRYHAANLAAVRFGVHEKMADWYGAFVTFDEGVSWQGEEL